MQQTPILGKRYIYDDGVGVVDHIDDENQLVEMHDCKTGQWRVRTWNELFPDDKPE